VARVKFAVCEALAFAGTIVRSSAVAVCCIKIFWPGEMAPTPGKVTTMTAKGSKDDRWAERTLASMRRASIAAIPITIVGGLEIDGEVQ
jgi:hypothetical protein